MPLSSWESPDCRPDMLLDNWESSDCIAAAPAAILPAPSASCAQEDAIPSTVCRLVSNLVRISEPPSIAINAAFSLSVSETPDFPASACKEDSKVCAPDAMDSNAALALLISASCSDAITESIPAANVFRLDCISAEPSISFAASPSSPNAAPS